jgi:hypothetical protein
MARSDSFITGRIHCRRPLLVIPTFRLQSGGGPYIARRVCRRDPLPRRLDGICGMGPQLAWGKESAPLERRVADFGKESVRPKGGGALSAARCVA